MKEYKGYQLLTVQLPNDESPVPHTLYLKKHDATDRTLFLCHLPSDASERHIQRLFRRCGEIEKITFQDGHLALQEDELLNHVDQVDEELMVFAAQRRTVWKPHISGSCCHVVFVDSEGLMNALNMKERQRIWTEGDDDFGQLYGIKKWTLQYFAERPPLSYLQQRVNRYMQEFDQQSALKRQLLLEQLNQPDEDGFVMVTRAKRNRNTNRDASGATVAAGRASEFEQLKPKKKELTNFYRFQMKETKQKELDILRQKFEQDKQKIAAMKAARKFKPY